jgi:hypothetical protein
VYTPTHDIRRRLESNGLHRSGERNHLVRPYDALNRLTSLNSSLAGNFGFGYDDLSRRRVDVQTIRALLDRCSDLRLTHEAPTWKQEISNLIQQQIQQLATQPDQLR